MSLLSSVGCLFRAKNERDETIRSIRKEAMEKKQVLEGMNVEWDTKEPDHVALARIMVDRGLYDVALRLLREANGPDRAEILFLIGVCYREKGLYETAITQFRKTLEFSPRYAQAYEGMALSYDLMGKGETAAKYYEQAIEENPSNPRYYNNFGVSLLNRGLFDEAAVQLERCVRLDPGFIRAFNNLGLAYGMAEKDEAALQAFLKVNDAENAYGNMAVMYRIRGDMEKSRIMSGKALEVNQDSRSTSPGMP